MRERIWSRIIVQFWIIQFSQLPNRCRRFLFLVELIEPRRLETNQIDDDLQIRIGGRFLQQQLFIVR